MNLVDFQEFLMWGVVIALVLLATLTGMWLNKFFTYRAHRRALAELHRRAMMSEKSINAEPVAVTTEAE